MGTAMVRGYAQFRVVVQRTLKQLVAAWVSFLPKSPAHTPGRRRRGSRSSACATAAGNQGCSACRIETVALEVIEFAQQRQRDPRLVAPVDRGRKGPGIVACVIAKVLVPFDGSVETYGNTLVERMIEVERGAAQAVVAHGQAEVAKFALSGRFETVLT
jgi:hypothetical protein